VVKGPLCFDVESSNPEIWNQIKDLEQREADAMLRADVRVLDALWSDDLLVNSTSNLIADKRILLGVIGVGRLRLRSYGRLTLRAMLNGDTIITTGNESSQLEGDTAGIVLHCSYMNAWIKRDPTWLLLGRHVALISRVAANSMRRS
jgi:hypothetical protein